MAYTTTMTQSTGRSAPRTEEIISSITALGNRVLRYGLALVIGWIGMMKFTGYEAQGIEPLVAPSPLLGWMYRVWSVRQFAAGLGIVEISIAILIALRPWSRKASAIGSAVAVLMFLTTLSFLFSTPGWEPSLGGFLALSGAVGQFLIKDVALLGAAIWSLGEALIRKRSRPSNPKHTRGQCHADNSIGLFLGLSPTEADAGRQGRAGCRVP